MQILDYKLFNNKNDFIKNSQIPTFMNLVYDDIIIANSYKYNNKWHYPFLPGYETIIVLMKSNSKWGYIGPYELQTSEGWLFENYWQFSKVYEETPNTVIMQYGKKIWEYKKTNFFTNGSPNEAYWLWRYKGFNHPIPVRYPVYKKNAHKCLYSIPEDDKTSKLNYIQARKQIYCKKYIESLQGKILFKELKNMYLSGKKLIITEIDCIDYHYSSYYKEKYAYLKNEPLQYGMINATKENIKIMLNDNKRSAGHAYPLAMALKDWNVEDIDN